MKAILMLFFILTQLTICKAQQFSFQMIFDDGNGGMDSITLGYDPSASDTIDASFGEANISSTFGFSLPCFASSNIWWIQNYPPFANQTGFETKTQIVKGSCGANFRIEIDIQSRYWPVTAHWNSSLFQDSCRNGSVFTSVNPFGWWDSTGVRVILASRDSFSFFPQNSYCCTSTTADTITVFWIGLGDSSLLSSVNDFESTTNSLRVFPTPTNDKINLQLPKLFGRLKTLEIYSSIGQLVMTLNSTTYISLSSLTDGLYYIVATNERSEKLIARILKQ